MQLAVDKEYSKGDPVFAWCGPQPNKRLLINYGIVDEDNPYDFLQIIASLRQSDPLFQIKRKLLLQHGFAAQKQARELIFNGKCCCFLGVSSTKAWSVSSWDSFISSSCLCHF